MPLIRYDPQPPTYAPDWYTSKDVGTQCSFDNAPNKYAKALKKHWVEGKNKRRLRIILNMVLEDETLSWCRMKKSGLFDELKRIKRTEGKKDKEIKKIIKKII